MGGVAGFFIGQKSGGGSTGNKVVAQYNGNKVYADEAFASVKGRIFDLEEEIFKTKEQAINNFVELQLLESASKAQNLAVEQLLEKETGGEIGEVKEEEIETFLTSKGLSLDDPRIRKDDVRDYLKYQRRFEKRQGYLASLKAKANYKILIEEPSAPMLTVATEGYPSWGNQNAPVTIVEFSDYECPFCSRAVPVLQQIKKEYGPEKVKIVFRDMPLPTHSRAEPAANAAHCANEQGKFWEYHDLLFENQDSLEDADLKDFASRAKIDVKQFTECYDSKKYQATVDKSKREAEALGIQATPSFVINGVLIQGAQPFDKFKEKIDRALGGPKS